MVETLAVAVTVLMTEVVAVAVIVLVTEAVAVAITEVVVVTVDGVKVKVEVTALMTVVETL